MRYTNLLFIFIFITLIISVNGKAAEPEQIHLATNGNEGEMVIQWGTIEDTWNFCPSPNDVEYGFDSDNLNFTKSGNNDMYLWNTCTHTVILTELKPNMTYYYRVGGDGEWSDVFSFVTLEENPEKIIIGAIADHGTSSNAQETTNHMENEDMDLVIHAGDTSRTWEFICFRIEGAKNAAKRKMEQELGIDPNLIDLEKLNYTSM